MTNILIPVITNILAFWEGLRGVRIDTAIKEYLLEIEVRRYAPRTIRSYRNNLNLFLRFCTERAEIVSFDAILQQIQRAVISWGPGVGAPGPGEQSAARPISTYFVSSSSFKQSPIFLRFVSMFLPFLYPSYKNMFQSHRLRLSPTDISSNASPASLCGPIHLK